jgi:hypothetical protein
MEDIVLARAYTSLQRARHLRERFERKAQWWMLDFPA